MQRREFIRNAAFGLAAVAIAPKLVLHKRQPEFELYHVEGQTEFPIYGPDGGICLGVVSYLYAKESRCVFPFDPTKTSLEDMLRFARGVENGDFAKGTAQIAA